MRISERAYQEYEKCGKNFKTVKYIRTIDKICDILEIPYFSMNIFIDDMQNLYVISMGFTESDFIKLEDSIKKENERISAYIKDLNKLEDFFGKEKMEKTIYECRNEYYENNV